MSIGEISYPDGYTVLVPQPIRFDFFNPNQCMSCGALRGRHFDDCQDNATQVIVMPAPVDTGVPYTLIMEAPEMPAEGPAWDARWLAASVVCFALGLPLMAVGSVFRDEVASAVWSWLR
jgi:hypothetical protein